MPANLATLGIFQREEVIRKRVEWVFPEELFEGGHIELAKVRGHERGKIGAAQSRSSLADESSRREPIERGEPRRLGHVVDHGSNLGEVVSDAGNRARATSRRDRWPRPR